MTLFVASWGADGAARARALDALRGYVGSFASSAGNEVRQTEWTGPAHVAWLSGAGPVTGERHAEDRVTLVDGVAIHGSGSAVVTAEDLASRPFGTVTADADLDGQFAILDAAADRLEIATDLLGLYTVHWCRTPDGWFLSNRVEPLARIAGARGFDQVAASAFVSVGWVTGERTLLENINTVPGGAHWVWRPGAAPAFDRPRDPWRVVGMPRRPIDYPALRDALIARCAAVGHWAGSVESGLTSGLDSRLLFMLLRAADVKTVYITGGHPTAPDVIVSQQIAETYGVDRRHIKPFAEDAVRAGWFDFARQLVSQNDGMVSLWQNIDLMRPPVAAPVSLWGVGGNIARSLYGTPRDLATRWAAPKQWRDIVEGHGDGQNLLTPGALRSARGEVDSFIATAGAEGIARHVIPDAFNTLELIGRWAAPNKRKIYPTPVFAPLSTQVWLRAAFSLAPVQRFSEPLHYNLFRLLAPGEDIANHPAGKWRSQIPYFNLLFGQARQRTIQNAGRDPLGIRYRIIELLREEMAARCLDRGSSPLWQVVDRSAFEAAMSGDDPVDVERRGVQARTLLAIMTLFEYEAFREEARA
ncbi:hypothetical protein IU500_17650 [Nocardia terpenica]|uniref:hypothetical protein n=1 Tax=Nocardia terpenica TaxID=455432 RepID=UPI001895C6E2|nr:hypothetical protein [Nocardia terpenica]MBF6063311.1 hypothetical protein [Nocardia terpenica]MBF6105867.1 hypothetical protein [Nocardia terpenica]MBF6113549.1 hypothetical protein [Nocardia terpenica]MBF6119608.1 hypothetical protein [Nocardia terpenica]MBF6152019.1 hypothetical protein [Nocardia terpenica]